MTRVRDRELVRYLAGGLGEAEAAALRRRIEADSEAALRLAAWERAWGGLELPPPGPVPAGFAAGVRARLAGAAATPFPLGPAWARALAAAALVAGLGLGSALGLSLANGGEGSGAGLWSEPALAEISWAPANGEAAP